MRAVVTGTGMYVPPNVVDNHRLSLMMETGDEWIRQRTGIVTRRFADRGQATSDLAVPAAEEAVRQAGIGKADIDYVVFATMTPDHYFPGAGPIFQHKFGLKTIPCLDIRQQCSGFLYGLQIADALIRSGRSRIVLLIGAEVHGGFMPWRSWEVALGMSDGPVPREEFEWNTRFRDRVVLFGDGAGAFVIAASGEDRAGLEDVIVHSDGAHADKMWVRGGGSAYRPYFEPRMFESGDTIPILEGRDVYRLAVTMMPEVVETILRRNGYCLGDLALLVMHQANLRINEAVQKRLGLPDRKVFNNIQRYGNTTAATLPIAFHEARTERALKGGDLVCFVALGSGLTWGAALYRC
ncbi:MAG: 3-oxoacyl-ACP synthase III family protein [Acidobacteriota bacterium]